MVRAAILVLAVAACSNLPAYEPVCGNGVIEPHEDCDSSAACFQCSQPCDAALACPTGLTCGGDFLCHAPGGQFRGQGELLPFDGQDLFTADVDGDRIGDLVEISATSLVTLHSQLGVGPVTETVLQTPFVTGPAAIGSFDAADQTQDVVLPTERGIAAYTSTQRVLSPYPFALDVSLPDPAEIARPYLVFPLDAGHMGMVTKLSHHDQSGTVTSEELDYVTIDITGGRPMFSAPAVDLRRTRARHGRGCRRAPARCDPPDGRDQRRDRGLRAAHRFPRARAAARAAGEDGSPRIRIDRQRAVPERARRSGFVPGSGWVPGVLDRHHRRAPRAARGPARTG